MRDSLNFLQDIYRANPSSDMKDLIKISKRNYKHELAKAKKISNDNYILRNNNKQKAMWNLINTTNNAKINHNKPSTISPDDFNNYFGNIAQNLVTTLPPSNVNFEYFLNNSKLDHIDEEFKFSEVTYIQVLDIIDNLKNTKSRDAYDIDVKVLNCIKYIIFIPLTKLINQCIRNNSFPTILKLSKVLPMFKKGCLDDPTNYRPISIVPIFAKIFEIVLKTQMTNYFENYNLFNNCQFGFRSKLSTTSAINSLMDVINNGFETKEFVHVQFLDLSKAFDCVPHNALVQKLSFYKFSANSKNLILSYLSDRSQFVNINNVKSNSIDIKLGVPQGSVLGPILFLIYINDLPNSAPMSNFTLFADDTTLAHTHVDQNVLLNEARISLSSVQEWLLSNKLVLNKDKTETIIFSLRQHTLEIDSSSSVKFLGVTLDTKLSWDKHTEIVCNKCVSENFPFT